MKKYYSIIITSLSFIAITIGLFASVNIVSAQSSTDSTAGQALEIAPPLISLNADPGQTVTAMINLRDVSSGNLVVTGKINDFLPSDTEGGVPKVVLDEDETSPYSLKSWVSPLEQLNLKSKQLKSLPIVIKVPTDASPGGYYGVVRFTSEAPDLEDTGVSLSASLGTLIFLRVNGEAKENLVIKSFYISKNGGKGTLFESAPLQFNETFENTGNLFEQPVGQITITDMFNKKVATVNVNLEQKYVLSSSKRDFNQTLDSATIGNMIMFGKYRADLRVNYSDSGKVLNQSITFWVIPYTLIALAIIAIVGGFFALRYAIVRYNQYIVSRSSGRHRRR